MEADTIPARTHKRARPIQYSSSSEDEVIDLTNINEVPQEGLSVSSLETGRLIQKIMENVAEAEVKRKTCGNIKGEVSGKMKSCHLEIMGVARELEARNRASCGPSLNESLEQLRAEAKATNTRLKQVEEECTRLRRELRRKDALLEKVTRGEAGRTTRETTIAASQTRSPVEERLTEARKDDGPEGGTMGRVLNGLTKAILRIQEELKEMRTGQGSYAQAVARPRAALPQPALAPRTSVPDGVGSATVGGRNRPGVPAEGPRPTREVRRDEPPGHSRGGEGGLVTGQQQQKKKKKKKKKKNGRRIRDTAAVSLTCAEGASYLEALKKLETGINLQDIGAKGLSYKRGLTGSFIWQLRGKDANAKADKLAQVMRGVLPEAKIARPQRTSPIKLVGIYPVTTLTAIRCGMQEARESISLKDIGIDKMTMRRGLTGAFIFSVRGKEAAVKADRVAEALGKAVPEAKIARPQRTRSFRLVGIDPSLNMTIIRNALLTIKGNVDPNKIWVGEIRAGRGRLWETVVSAPVEMAQAVINRGGGRLRSIPGKGGRTSTKATALPSMPGQGACCCGLP
ncbi:hypothetical protein M0804_015025 [Polistes exclamans]|nr:hypothetical protein M0804_015025 [Polistes exclamans]